MTKIDIFSGFLGAGKTTLIKKLISEAYIGEKLVLIENEFGEIGVDSGFLKDAGVEITEMNSGCICCSLVGDFGVALKKVLDDFSPDRIIIEPSGVGKLSDVIKAASSVVSDNACVNSTVTVVDANKCKMYMKNFGEFFNDQIKHAGAVILSHTDNCTVDKLNKCTELIKNENNDAVLITTPWDQLSGSDILDAIERKNTLEAELHELEHHHGEHCCCHDHEHHHDHDKHCDCHEHEHHHHDEHCDCHEHHHDHDEHCTCGCHDHEHHHHADDVFISWGKETANVYSEDKLRDILSALDDCNPYGMILRAKGIVSAGDGKWIHFDYIPGEADVRSGSASVTGRICVIGSEIKEDCLAKLFDI